MEKAQEAMFYPELALVLFRVLQMVGKALLLKIMLTQLIEHGEVELVPT